MKKTISVITLIPRSSRFYAEQVQALFGQWAQVHSYSTGDRSVEGIVESDLYLLSMNSLVVLAPMGYPHKSPLIRQKLPWSESCRTYERIGLKGPVSMWMASRATITPEHIINGRRVGRTTLPQRRMPCLAPSSASPGLNKSMSRHRTDR